MDKIDEYDRDEQDLEFEPIIDFIKKEWIVIVLLFMMLLLLMFHFNEIEACNRFWLNYTESFKYCIS